MFQNDRYITKGIEIEIPLETQLFLWGLIDERLKSGSKLDYLQVFNLSIKKDKYCNFFQLIEHVQEVPRYKCNHIIQAEKILNTKIFVIDSDTYSTMLLASEY